MPNSRNAPCGYPSRSHLGSQPFAVQSRDTFGTISPDRATISPISRRGFKLVHTLLETMACNSYRLTFCIAPRLPYPRKAPSPPVNPLECAWPRPDALLKIGFGSRWPAKAGHRFFRAKRFVDWSSLQPCFRANCSAKRSRSFRVTFRTSK